jgi:hypothetical protein
MSAARRTRDYGVWWMSIPYGTTGLLMELVRRIPSPFPRLFSSYHVRFEALGFLQISQFPKTTRVRTPQDPEWSLGLVRTDTVGRAR